MMDTQVALQVHTYEALEKFLQQHRKLVYLGYFPEIEWVKFSEANGIMLVKFSEEKDNG